jgi:DNA repair photolyase
MEIKKMRVIDKIVACMEINTSIGCPNACVFCPQERFVKAYKKRSGIDFNKNMSLQNFKNCLDKIPRYVRINFSGMSEPWLNPDCTKMLLYAHKKGFTITVFTTTVGLSIKDIDLIKKIPFKSFTVHLPEKNNKFSKIPYDDELLKKIDKIVECISNLKFMAFGEVRPEIKKSLEREI